MLKCKRDGTDVILVHLNSIEPEHITFNKEEEVEGKLTVLDLKLSINRKTKKIEYSVHNKKAHTNITIKKKSNRKESIKKAIIKGYADRVRVLCDEQHLESEMNNITGVFRGNGYKEKEIEKAMKEKEKAKEQQEEQRG